LAGGEISHKDLMSHVKSLEQDLTEIGQTLGDGTTNGVLSGEGLIKQTDTGKRLLQQLQAMKHMAISTDAEASGTTAPKVVSTEPTGDGNVCGTVKMIQQFSCIGTHIMICIADNLFILQKNPH